ncbi:hypothetical protein [Variovorax boronicumulans]|uniref:hypothetical protein n=1 Tax=Variovorax boronicumulans TaxID=436515 RepID=UPI0033987061
MSTSARRVFLVACCAALGLAQWGCASAPDDGPVRGKDEILSLLASKDGRRIVIAGEKYHYVLVGDPAVASLLRWENRVKITPALTAEFKVAPDQSVEGQYVLMAYDADLTPEDRRFLVATGFAKTEVKYGDRTGTALRYFGSIKGARYLAGPIRKTDAVDFSRTHYLHYVELRTISGDAAAKPAATPLAYGPDGTLLAGGVPVFRVEGGTDISCRASVMGFCLYR